LLFSKTAKTKTTLSQAVSLIIEALPKEIITKEVNVQNNQGNSPLHAAYVFYGDPVVQILKQHSLVLNENKTIINSLNLNPNL